MVFFSSQFSFNPFYFIRFLSAPVAPVDPIHFRISTFCIGPNCSIGNDIGFIAKYHIFNVKDDCNWHSIWPTEVSSLLYTVLYPALYLVGFAALHSFLASLTAKRAARRLFGDRVDPWYPIFFSAIAVVTVMPLVALLAIFPGRVLYVIPTPWFWLFVFAQIMVGIGSLRAFLDAPHRFLIRAQLAGSQSPDSFALAARGIYCSIRDPFLLSGFLLIWLTPFMTENLLAVYLLITVYLFLGSLHWESRLAHQFGQAYLAYRSEVPRMIPRGRKRWRECGRRSS